MKLIRGNNRWLVIALHGMVWFMLFGIPILLTSGETTILRKIVAHSWLPLGAYALVFYINYLWLVNKYFFTRKLLWYAVLNVIFILAIVYATMELRSYFFSYEMKPDDSHHVRPPKRLFVYLETLWAAVPLFFAIALRILERWRKSQTQQKEVATVQLQSELQHLRYQLQPHFFFNSLNNIYSLVDVSPDRAKETIHALGKLMRYLLYETNTDLVSLSREIDFMQKYIELMQIRTSDKTRIFVQFPEVKKDVQIAPLLFISLIENAFKHGVSADQEVAIFFDMQVDKNRIRFVARNQNLPKSDTDKSGSGIGLNNLEKRLELLYPDAYLFVRRIEGEQFIAELELFMNDSK
jgi:sensor histidine kinase YesM